MRGGSVGDPPRGLRAPSENQDSNLTVTVTLCVTLGHNLTPLGLLGLIHRGRGVPTPRGAGRLAWRPRPVLGLQAAAGVPVDPSLSIAPCWSEGTRRGGHGHMMAPGGEAGGPGGVGRGADPVRQAGCPGGQAAPLPAFMLVVKPAGPRGEPRRGRRPSGRQREPRCKIRKHRRAAPACAPPPPPHRSLRGGCASNRNEAAQPSPPPRGRAGSPRGLESWEVPSSRVGIQSWFSWERHGADTTRASRRGLWLCRAGQLRGKCPWPVSGPESRNFPTSTCTHPGTPS